MSDENMDNGGQDTTTNNGGGSASWLETLPQELRESPSITKFKDGGVESMAKSYVELSSLIGKRAELDPSQPLTDEQKGAFYKAIGRPDSPEAYAIDAVEVPEALAELNSQDVHNNFKGIAHKLNLTNDQVNELYKWYAEDSKTKYGSAMEANQKKTDDEFLLLKQAYGTNYDSNITMAKEAAEKLGQPELAEVVDKSPAIAKLLVSAGKLMSDDGTHFGSRQQGRNLATVQSEMNAMIMDKDGPFHIAYHPEHNAAVARFQELSKELAELQG